MPSMVYAQFRIRLGDDSHELPCDFVILKRLRIIWTSEDHSNYSIIKIGHNTEKDPGDLRRLAVT